MIDKKELQIIASLRKNSRTRLTKLSKVLGIPISTIFSKIKQNQGGLIMQNTVLLDFNYIGFNTRAYVFMKVDKRQKKDFTEFLLKHNNVNSLYKVNNGFDCMAELVFRNLKELEAFLEILEGKYRLQRKDVHYIIDDLKREKFFSDPEMIDSLMK
ncbi:Lrp/AsnC family transcriptional regulator [archaeon]|nr:Lrp/AsnC family transcriptional regulator [archaeon]